MIFVCYHSLLKLSIFWTSKPKHAPNPLAISWDLVATNRLPKYQLFISLRVLKSHNFAYAP
jgi:hypothetical protein